ncbi:transcription initiation factor TFIID subunit 1-like [Aphidius gifuensis]|nr:transcription initiation factor TFIID subunit 1-like [Aphidius gifuensis]
MNNEMNETAASTWNSILPFDNDELANNKWEDDIIWDPMNMKEIPKPKILTLDLNDDNIIFNIPEDKGNFKEKDEPKKKVKVTNPHMKKTQMLLGEAGFIPQVQEEIIPKKIENNDPFNISNDIYYMAKQETSIKMNISGGNLMQHSIPVVELRDPFIKTHMSIKSLRNFHRMPLKRLNNCQLSYPGPHKIKPLTLNIIKKAKQREQERIASGGGDVFFMRTPQDLSAKDSKLVLVEYSEQYPPLISQPGMCSKIKNYYKRYPSNDNGPKNYEFGETVYSYKSPFLGSLTPGQTIQTIENNMYRSPIYQHDIPKTDFIIIRTSNQYYIREYDGLFIAGQECPLYEVPAPNSKLANNFVRDFLQVYIYRLFFKSNDIPKKIKMEDIRKAFPGLSESTIRKRLKLCADYQRTGIDSNWWVIRNDFRLPTEDEMREMITPEKCCAYYSMIAGEQRLKDAGYGCEKSLLLPQQDDDDDDIINKKDDEVQAAPWNTTRTYIQSLKGKCLLQLTGPADPTGIGEGFSYIRVPNKPIVNKDQLKESKKQLRGTSSDLRRLDLKKAKEILLQYGLNKKVIDELGRWEIIAVVRTLSTQKAKSGTDDIDIEAVIQFSRGNRHSIAEHHERYKDECQRIFDLQNHILASNEVLSTDDDDDSDSHDNNSDDDDNNNSDNYEEMGKNIENMLNNKKTCLELTKEKEEQARKELMKMINDDNNNINDTKNNNNNHDKNKNIIKKNKTLKISRTYRDDYGKEYTRTEIISNQKVIDLYLKTRELKDDESIRKIATDNDFQAKEEERRARRRKQEQDRRKRKNEAKCAAAAAAFANKSVLNIYNRNDKTIFNNHDDDGGDGDSLNCTNKKLQLKTDSKFKCGACGSVGHMRTNRACPYFNKSSMSIIDNQENDNNNYQKNNHYEDKDLINVEGIKIKFSSTVIKMANEHNAELMKRKSQSFKHLKNSNDGKKRKRQDDNDDDYYYDNKKISNKRINRRRTNPVVVMTTIFENILQNIQKLSYVTPFILPVTIRQAPDYHIKIMKPMDLQKIRDKLRQTKYKHRKEFLDDFIQIYENSKIYNGENHELTIAAQKMMELCADKIIEEEEKLMILEREINPFVDDNDETKLAFIFKKILNTTIKLMPEVFPFNKPVNKKQYKEYYNIVKRPMDLEKIFTQIDNHMYKNRHVFLQDIKQILYNCELYNGKKHPLVAIANKLYTGCKNLLDQYDGCNNNQLSELENKNSTNHCQENNSLNLQFVPDDINYTIAEPETRISQTNISLNQLCDSSINDDIFVDVEGDVEVDVVGEEVIQAKEEKQIKEEMIKFENNGDNNIVVDDTDDMKTIDILKEDLKSSSEDDNDDDDDFEEVPFDANKNSYDLNEFDKFINAPQVPVGDDDHSQQSTQSIDISYFNQQQITQQEEVMDVDLNYDQTQYHSTEVSPEQDNINSDTIHDDLAVSDSDEEHDKHNTSQPGAIWF